MSTTDEHQTLWQTLRIAFGRGVVVIVPLAITYWVLKSLFLTIDDIISPIFDQVLHQHIPGLGFISMFVLIMVVGILSRNLIGVAVFKFFEKIIFTIPLARTIYSAMRDLFSAFQPGKKGKSFRQVVLIEYPRPGLSTIGFVTNEFSIRNATPHSELVSVYILNPPNPTSGVLVLVPRSEIQVLNMTVEEGLKLALSGGIVTPKSMSVQ